MGIKRTGPHTPITIDRNGLDERIWKLFTELHENPTILNAYARQRVNAFIDNEIKAYPCTNGLQEKPDR